MGAYLYVCMVALATLGVLLGVFLILGKLFIIRLHATHRSGTTKLNPVDIFLTLLAYATLAGVVIWVARRLVNGEEVRGLAGS